MFEVGQYIVYGAMGICRVREIAVPSFCARGEERQYYTLTPVNETGEILVPVDANVFMRPIITREEAERLIDLIPTIRADAHHGERIQDLKVRYAEALRSHDCADLIELVMSIYARNRSRRQQNLRIGQIDENYMKRAESLLYGEFSLALGIPAADVEAYIRSRVRAAAKPAREKSGRDTPAVTLDTPE